MAGDCRSTRFNFSSTLSNVPMKTQSLSVPEKPLPENVVAPFFTSPFKGTRVLSAPLPGSPRAYMTASNLRGAIHRSFELEYSYKSVTLDELIGLATREYHVEIPLHHQCDRAARENNLNWFDWIDLEEEHRKKWRRGPVG